MTTEQKLTLEAIAALSLIDRLRGQLANSTARRDRFTLTRREVEQLLAVGTLLEQSARYPSVGAVAK
jgi:hypothetical protein